MNINHKEIELDIEGYLVHPEDWNKEIALALAKLFNLFPYGYVKQACKISGMKRPRGWSTG